MFELILLIETWLGLLFMVIECSYAWKLGKSGLESGIVHDWVVFMNLVQVDEFDWFWLMINYLKVFIITMKHLETCIKA